MRNGSRVGVFTTPKLVRQGSNANVPCTRYWHQGFGVIMQDGAEVVAFTTRATAVRVAAQATANTKIDMTVVPVDGIGWGYRRA